MKTLSKSKSGNSILSILAFGMVYFVWGGNFVAIHFSIQSIPPFLMVGLRFVTAGLLLLVFNLARGEAMPSFGKWLPSAAQGFWLNVIGSGALVWSEQYLPSGFAAIIVATIPIWMVILDKDRWRDYFTKPSVILGILLGLLGVIMLSISQLTILADTSNFIPALIVLVVGTLSWSHGSLLASKTKIEVSLFMNLSIQMLVAGLMLTTIGVIFGELSLFSIQNITLTSRLAFVFQIVFGSILGYLAYLWLLQRKSPAIVGSYAFIHPVVAVFLGWLLANEPVGLRIFLALIIILTGVLLIKYPHKLSFIKKYIYLTHKRKLSMIARTWHGMVPKEKKEQYLTYLKETGLKDYQETKGNLGVKVLQNDEGKTTHFLLITFWDSYESIKKFAGKNYEIARYYPEDKDYLLEFEPNVHHYEVVSE